MSIVKKTTSIVSTSIASVVDAVCLSKRQQESKDWSILDGLWTVLEFIAEFTLLQNTRTTTKGSRICVYSRQQSTTRECCVQFSVCVGCWRHTTKNSTVFCIGHVHMCQLYIATLCLIHQWLNRLSWNDGRRMGLSESNWPSTYCPLL